MTFMWVVVNNNLPHIYVRGMLCRLREEATCRWLPICYGAFKLNECESGSDVAIWWAIRIFNVLFVLTG